jgi:hypothetical protein
METIEKRKVSRVPSWQGGSGGVFTAFTISREDPEFENFLKFVARRRIQEEAESYADLAAHASGPEVRKFFSSLAELKKKEADQVEAYAEGGHFPLQDTAHLPPPALQRSTVEGEVIGTLEEACRLALKFEVANYCLHIHLAEREEHAATRRLFLFLVQIHKANLQHIENCLRESVNKR